MKTFCFIFLLAFLISCDSIAQTLNSDTIRSWISRYKTPAVGIAVIENNSVQQSTVFGTLDGKRPAPQETIFNVASLTKPVVAMVTLRLVADGKWNLDESLSKYWVDPDIAEDPRHDKLTTRMILSHQTGFPNWRWLNGATALTFQSDPGTTFSYSGEGFEYLRKALEKKFNKQLSEITQDVLFNPIGIKNTRFTWDPRIANNFAEWHDRNGRNSYSIRKTEEDCAADDLITSINDYALFAAYTLESAGLPQDGVTDMIKSQVHVKDHVDYGLGWMIVRDLPNNEYALVHTGADDGVRTAVILLPESKRGVVIFTNGDNGMEIIKRVVPSVLGSSGVTILEYLK